MKWSGRERESIFVLGSEMEERDFGGFFFLLLLLYTRSKITTPTSFARTSSLIITNIHGTSSLLLSSPLLSSPLPSSKNVHIPPSHPPNPIHLPPHLPPRPLPPPHPLSQIRLQARNQIPPTRQIPRSLLPLPKHQKLPGADLPRIMAALPVRDGQANARVLDTRPAHARYVGCGKSQDDIS